MNIGRFKFNEISISRIVRAIEHRFTNQIIYKRWMLSRGKRNRELLYKYKDIHKGERCYVIANGPSLKKIDLNLLKNKYTFGMNRIYLLFDELGFETTYYSCVNELVLSQFNNDIDELNTTKFLNWKQHKIFSTKKNNLFIKTFSSLKDGFSDQGNEIYSGGTVTYACLQLAYFMGFSEVIIIGMDHNFKEKGEANKVETRKSEKDESHFHPDYFPKGIKWQLPDLLRSELAYEKARNAFEKDGRIIVDATIDGKCDVFHKMDFNDVLGIPVGELKIS